MLKQCEEAVQAAAQAAGRAKLTSNQLADLESRIAAAQRRMARQDPQAVSSMTAQDRFRSAADLVMADIRAKAAKDRENAQRQIILTAETGQRIDRLQGSFTDAKGHDGTRAEALKADLTHTGHYIKAIAHEALGRMMATIEALGNTKGAGVGRQILMKVFDAENPMMTRDFVRELFASADGSTGNKEAQLGAQTWLDTIEGMRQRFNAAGGDVRKLAYGYVPQPHDAAAVRKAGPEAWADRTLPLLDRRQYVNDDGSRMSDDQVRDMLRKAWETITTEGQNKTEPGQFKGTGKRANRGQDERQIHFKDGDAYLAYMKDFGRGPMFDAMARHVHGMARDIGLVERYGPDPAAQARLQFDLTALADKTQPGKLVGWNKVNPETMWNIVSGRVGMPESDGIAATFGGVRNLMSASKLGAAVLTSFADLGTLVVTTGYNRLGYWKLLKDIALNAGKHSDASEFMSSHGMIAEALTNGLNRWSGDFIGSGWTGKLSNATMKLSLLNAWTDGLRQGFKMTFNAKLMEMAGKDWNALSEFDQRHLTRAGFTPEDWATMNKVQPTDFKGRQMLTPDAIVATGDPGAPNLATRMLGFVQDESEYAVVNPDIRTRAITTLGGKEAGTMAGELARTVMQFKAFPISMLTRHWSRAMEGGADGGPALANRYAYGMALTASLMALGAITVQSKQILSGQDPIDMKKPRFWAKALATGGALGVAGDLFLIDPQNNGTDTATTMVKNYAGPAAGAVAELVGKLGIENAWQYAEGKDTHAAAEAMNWIKSNTPGASLWWLRPLIDHGFMNQLNEAASPGFLGRMKQRAMQNWGTRYWWNPNSMQPDRAPDMAHSVGG